MHRESSYFCDTIGTVVAIEYLFNQYILHCYANLQFKIIRDKNICNAIE